MLAILKIYAFMFLLMAVGVGTGMIATAAVSHDIVDQSALPAFAIVQTPACGNCD